MNFIEKRATITKRVEERINNLLKEPQSEDEWVGDGTLYRFTVTFDDGHFMDISVCGVSYYEDGGCNSAWTQAVLYDKNGAELCYSDVGEDFFGYWALDDGNNTYVAILEKE